MSTRSIIVPKIDISILKKCPLLWKFLDGNLIEVLRWDFHRINEGCNCEANGFGADTNDDFKPFIFEQNLSTIRAETAKSIEKAIIKAKDASSETVCGESEFQMTTVGANVTGYSTDDGTTPGDYWNGLQEEANEDIKEKIKNL